MKTEVMYFATFAVGVTIGSVVTYKVVKTKYEQLAQEQIDSVKETFSKMIKNEHEKVTKELVSDDTVENVFVAADSIDEVIENRKEMHDIINSNGYRGHSVENYELEEKDDMHEPYVIPPEEYGEYMDYEQIELTYFADGVLTDEYNERIDDIAGTVGEDFADHFGEYEDDSVYVRNDERRCEYEILADVRNYSDIVEDDIGGGVDESDYL